MLNSLFVRFTSAESLHVRLQLDHILHRDYFLIYILYLALRRPMEPAVPPIYAMIVVIWAVVFLQFWRRQNAALQNKYVFFYGSSFHNRASKFSGLAFWIVLIVKLSC